MATLREQAEALVKKFGPVIAEAFRRSIEEIKSRIVLRAVVDRLKVSDLDGAVEAMNIGRAAFIELEQAIEAAYGAGGRFTIGGIALPRSPSGGARIVVRFDVRNPVAETWLRGRSSDLVTNIIADQKDGIRQALSYGMSQGRNPTQTALDVVGRVNRATGKRDGGIIGLTRPQQEFVTSAKAELMSGDPAVMQNYFTRTRRDKRFDGTVKKAMDAGKPVDAETAQKIAGRYADSLLKLRGDTIGLNETRIAMEASKHEAYRQAAEAGKVSETAVVRKWRHLPSKHPRHLHIAMAGKTAGLSQPFTLPDGTVMMYPHDPKAPASQTIGCLCQLDYEIDFTQGLL